MDLVAEVCLNHTATCQPQNPPFGAVWPWEQAAARPWAGLAVPSPWQALSSAGPGHACGLPAAVN